MCYVHGLIKGLWHMKPWFNHCKVRGEWFFTGCSSVVHEKLFNKYTTKEFKLLAILALAKVLLLKFLKVQH